MRVIGVRLWAVALMLLMIFLAVTVARLADAHEKYRIGEEVERRGYCTQ